MPQHLLTETSIRVRYAETDMMRIVHHSAYVVYLEEGRSNLARQHNAPVMMLEDMGYSLAVTDLHVRYYASARYDNLLRLHTWIDALQSRGISFGYELTNAETGEKLITGTSKHICIDRLGQVKVIPEAWSSILKSAMANGV